MNKFSIYFSDLKTRLRAVLPPPRPPRGTLPLAFATPRIVPKVRPRFSYEVFGLRNPGRRPEAKVLAGSFGQSLVVDCAEGEIEVTSAHLAAWGLTFDSMMNKAKTNLLARGGEERFERSKTGFYRSTWEDALAGSRILLPGMLRRLRLEGDPVVFLPRKEVLLVAGSEDPAGLCAALEASLELMDAASQPMNGCPLRLRHFQWDTFTVTDGHPAAPLLARAQRRRLLEEYGQQKRLLDGLHQREGRVIAVAPFGVGPSPSGHVSSFTHWTREMVDGWLPEADRVCLTWSSGAGPRSLWLPWALVRRRLDPFLEPLGLFPERHRIRAFPGLELLEDLAAWDGWAGMGELA